MHNHSTRNIRNRKEIDVDRREYGDKPSLEISYYEISAMTKSIEIREYDIMQTLIQIKITKYENEISRKYIKAINIIIKKLSKMIKEI